MKIKIVYCVTKPNGSEYYSNKRVAEKRLEEITKNDTVFTFGNMRYNIPISAFGYEICPIKVILGDSNED